jgi:hypothetical protein
MLTVTEKVLFLLLAAGTLYFGAKQFYQVYRVIARGKPEDRFDNLGGSIWRALGIVLTQQSVFKARPVISFFHGLVFYGFVFYLLVNLVDVIEGLFGVRTTGTSWSLYNLSADLMTASVLVGIVALIVRRYWARPGDFAFRPNVPLQPEVRPGIAANGATVIDATGLVVYRIGDDGKLAFARKYDVDVGAKTQFWSGMVTLA